MSYTYKNLIAATLASLMLASCAQKTEVANPIAIASEKSQEDLAEQINNLPTEDATQPAFQDDHSGRAMGPQNRASLIAKARKKRMDASLFRTNESIIKANGKHTKIYPFTGKYKVMVIPVQFSDVKFEDPRFFKKGADGKSEAQEYVFGKSKNSMASYYKHVSLGNLKLEGEVTPIITIDRPLAEYGAAVANSSDKNAPGLVVQALKQLKKLNKDMDWWDDFDQWDLSDYDKDTNYHEPDGFIDAVVLVYAGKSQASCQSSFDTDGSRPASDDVPAGPRHDAAVECYNRIWPHRWSMNISKDSPDFSKVGPKVEGKQRPAMNGFKINDHLFANDYNMQSEFSDRSTFIHEFGHSLSLPDVYSGGEGNSTGSWEVMSSNAGLQAQEMSSYSKITLGWLAPKIVKQGEETSAYLGAYSFVSPEQREELRHYAGPNLSGEVGNMTSIVSQVPDSGENVYRSIMVITDPSKEELDIVSFPDHVGNRAAYSSRYNGESRGLTYKVTVPLEGDATFSFDTIYHIETETNFSSKDEVIKVVTDFDTGKVSIDDEELETLRIVSGDTDYDTLADLNPNCKQADVLKLRAKVNAGIATDEDKVSYREGLKVCKKPIWVKKSYDLKAHRGKTVTLKIAYLTDPGYTEFGMVIDNVKLPGQKVIDFEAEESTMEFVSLVDGKETIEFQQYYLFEYRDPKVDYAVNGETQSYNFDKNISVGSQSMFTSEGADVLEKFRMVTFDYQPGVLAWYFNSKFDSGPSGNDAVKNGGKGYLLVLNSKVKEVVLPGIFSNPDFLDENGRYIDRKENPLFDALLKQQRKDYICFSHTVYATYLNGEAPECVDDEFKDKMLDLSFNGLSLIHRRERFNETLPTARYGTHGVGRPFRMFTSVRTGLSTFRAPEAGEYKPFKVYKEENGEMILDVELTDSSASFAPVSTFKDSDSELDADEDFQGDTVVVEKTGFGFQVANPSKQILKRYDATLSAEDNDTKNRAPKAKLYFSWD